MANNLIFEKDKWLSFTSFLQTTWLYPFFGLEKERDEKFSC